MDVLVFGSRFGVLPVFIGLCACSAAAAVAAVDRLGCEKHCSAVVHTHTAHMVV
jgi:hypothetical protein